MKSADSKRAKKDQPPEIDPLKVLVIDDEESHAEVVGETLERLGYSARVAFSGEEGRKLIDREEFDVILTDLRMEDVDGMDILRFAKEEQPDAEVIVITGHGDVKSAVAAMREGASNYVNKPVSKGELQTMLEKAAERLTLTKQNRQFREQLDEKFGFEGVVGESQAMHRVIEKLRQIAPSSASVLILGETGTGKELVAKALHNNSPRKNKPFIALNCSAFNENLLDDELFGHEPGSFTGATKARKGRFEAAHGGTLFLDEVGDMPLSLQAKLLRVLETGEITRIGSNDPVKVNVRVIAATHKDLEAAIAAGEFRQDLYYRLRVVMVRLPSLRGRREDLPRLANHFLKELNEREGKDVERISDALMRTMTAYHWEGNVRELRNLMHSMVVLDTDGVLDLDDLSLADPEQKLHTPGEPVAAGSDGLVGKSMAEIERYYVERTLEMVDGNRAEAARLLGIGERTLYRLINEWKIDDEIRQYMEELDGDTAAVAKRVEMSEDELQRKLRKLGLAEVGG